MGTLGLALCSYRDVVEVGALRPTFCGPQCVLLHASFLPVACQLVK
jgi:hypothetical protein